MAEPLLRVESISKKFGSLQVMDTISFSLEKGEIIGLVGRRGAGKTTLLHLLGGAIAPTGGELVFDGRRAPFLNRKQARRQGIELVCHNPLIINQFDVIKNIFMGREYCWPTRYGIPNWERMYLRSRELLTDFDLPESVLRAPTTSLSDEQRQVIALARAFCRPCKLLLLDDFLPILSFQRQQIVLERIQNLARQGTGVVISSENLKHLFSITDRILVLYEGRLFADRRTSECTPRDIVELIVGAASREQVTPIIWALESYQAAERQTAELFRQQAALHKSLEASDSLNRELVQKLSQQVKALDRLNAALQQTQLRLMTEREEERKALARELHDQIIQDLLSTNYRLEESEDDEIPEQHRAELIAIREGIRQVVADLRQLCRDLRPPTIDNHGLTAAIRSLAQEWAERNGLTLLLNIDPDLGRLPETIELSVFRIVQEGINNIAKHAEAKTVSLTMRRTAANSLLVRIMDDGQGLANAPDLVNLSEHKHFGLVGISERAALLGGTMRIESPPDGGLVLQVEIPSPYPSG